jgi:hypothetical protein
MVFVELFFEVIVSVVIMRSGISVRWGFSAAIKKMSGQPITPHNRYVTKMLKDSNHSNRVSDAIINFLLGVSFISFVAMLLYLSSRIFI